MNIWQIQFSIINKRTGNRVEVQHLACGEFNSALLWAKAQVNEFNKNKENKKIGDKAEIICIQKTIANCAVAPIKTKVAKGKKKKKSR